MAVKCAQRRFCNTTVSIVLLQFPQDSLCVRQQQVYTRELGVLYEYYVTCSQQGSVEENPGKCFPGFEFSRGILLRILWIK
jgi:hypothetical protein